MCTQAGPPWLLSKSNALCYAPLVFASVSSLFLFFPFDLFFFFFSIVAVFTCARRTQTPQWSWITYGFGSPKLIEFLKPISLQKENKKNYASSMHSKTPRALSILFPFLMCNKINSNYTVYIFTADAQLLFYKYK